MSTLKPKPIDVQIPITIFFEDSFIMLEGVMIYSFTREQVPLKTPAWE